MRILHVYKTSIPTTMGGIQMFIDTLSQHSCKLGVENTVLSLADVNETQRLKINGYDVILAKQNLFVASTGFSISAFSLYNELAKSADIIHFYFPNPFGDLLHTFSKIKKPTLVTYQSDIVKQRKLMFLYRPLMRRFLNAVDKIIATSGNYLDSSKVLQSYLDKCDIIPIGISKPKMSNKIQYKISTWKSKLPEKFFLFIGELRYYKGLHTAIEAVAGTDIPLIIVGKGGVEKKLKKKARDYNAKNVHFLGAQSEDDKWALINLCYGFVMPSHLRSEAFGISQLEAAAVGKPLISCEIGTGTSFVNADQITGIVIAPSSPHELRVAMERLLKDEELAQKFGRNAKLRYQELFTAENQAKKYLEVYEEMLANKEIN